MFVVKRSHHNPILTPDHNHNWEAFSVFNMSVVKRGRKYYGVYRAISGKDKMRTPDHMSTLGVGTATDTTHFENRVPLVVPEEEWEQYGCEDPRVTFFEGKYYIFYTALSHYPFDASGIRVAVAVTKDMKKIKERHLVTSFNSKAMTLFPERINGKVTVIVSVNTDVPPVKIAIAQVDEVEELWNPAFWENWYKNIDEHLVDFGRSAYDHLEVGATPIKTKYGWLLIYSHIQNYFPNPENLDHVFGIEAVLLDFEDPKKIVGRTRGPLLVPLEAYELFGYVHNVIFSCGAILEKDVLYIYYGAADTTICMAHVNLNDLLSTMRSETSTKWHFERFAKNPIISPISSHPWESKATFNPAAILIGDTTHILYRALSDDNTSTIGYASTRDGLNIDERLADPIYVPREDFESKKVPGGNSGCEDPRLTLIGKEIFMCYTAYDGIDLWRVALSSISVKDFLAKKWNWTKPVIITPDGFDDKDTCIFPEKINGEYFILHRVGDEMCGDYFKTLDFKKERVKKCIRILGPRVNMWDSGKVGVCAPPIKTKYGWFLLYHGVSKTHGVYRVGAILLDLKDPSILIARTTDPIFEPKEIYEKVGVISNVVFPCGMVVKDKTLYIYYGGADKVIGVATMDFDIIMNALTRDVVTKKAKK